MSDEVSIDEIRSSSADSLVNEESRILDDQDWLPKFLGGFGYEFEANPNHFSARSKDKRTYYLISNRGKKEALMGVYFHNSSVADIGAFGRLFKKVDEDKITLEGYRYLQVLLDEELIPKGIRRVEAQLVTPGSLEAFEQLEKECRGGHGKYKVVILKNNIVPLAIIDINANDA